MSLPLAGGAAWLQPPPTPSYCGYGGTDDKHWDGTSQVLAASVALVPLQPWHGEARPNLPRCRGRESIVFPGSATSAEPLASPHGPRVPGGAVLPQDRDRMGTLLRVLSITPHRQQGEEVGQRQEFGNVPPAPLPPGTASRCRARGKGLHGAGAPRFPRPGDVTCTPREPGGDILEHLTKIVPFPCCTRRRERQRQPRGGGGSLPPANLRCFSCTRGAALVIAASPLPPSSGTAQGCGWGTPITHTRCRPCPPPCSSR